MPHQWWAVAPVAEIIVRKQPTADNTLHRVITFLRLCIPSGSPPWWHKALAILVLCMTTLKSLSSSIVWGVLADAFVGPVAQCYFFPCPDQLILPRFHRCWSQGHFLKTFVHHQLHFRVYFWRITVCKNIWCYPLLNNQLQPKYPFSCLLTQVCLPPSI